MKKWLKQRFCSHIFKVVDGSWQYLRTTTFQQIFFYDYYSVMQCCVKCGKEKIVESKQEDISGRGGRYK